MEPRYSARYGGVDIPFVERKAGGQMSHDISPLIRESAWDSIREQFTEAEKVELRKHVTGKVICPRGFCIDWDALFASDTNLYRKLTSALTTPTEKSEER